MERFRSHFRDNERRNVTKGVSRHFVESGSTTDDLSFLPIMKVNIALAKGVLAFPKRMHSIPFHHSSKIWPSTFFVALQAHMPAVQFKIVGKLLLGEKQVEGKRKKKE